MFGIGMPELLLILAVALVVIGPKKLPDLAKSLGKALGEFKRATNDLKQSIEKDTGLDEVRQNLRETGKDVRRSFDATDARPASASGNANAAATVSPAPDNEAQADAAYEASEATKPDDAEFDNKTDAAEPNTPKGNAPQ
ncbi:MAG: Sec-independent protein translocase protein TatB [Desulfatitalea sp.]